MSLEAGKKKQGSWAKQLCRKQRENYSQDHVLNTILTVDFSLDPQGWLGRFSLRSVRHNHFNTLEDSG